MSIEDDEGMIAIPIEDLHHAGLIWQLVGADVILTALRSEPSMAPGMRLAQAIAEKEVAELRVQMAGHSLRLAARNHDLQAHPEVYTTVRDGKPVVLLKPQGELDV